MIAARQAAYILLHETKEVLSLLPLFDRVYAEFYFEPLNYSGDVPCTRVPGTMAFRTLSNDKEDQCQQLDVLAYKDRESRSLKHDRDCVSLK